MPRLAWILSALLLPSMALAQATIQLPVVAATGQDVDLELASSHFNAPSLDGVLDPSDTVTIVAAGGTVSLATTSNLGMVSGDGDEDPTVPSPPSGRRGTRGATDGP